MLRILLITFLIPIFMVYPEDQFLYNGKKYTVVEEEDIQKLLGFLLLKSKNEVVSTPSFQKIKIDQFYKMKSFTGQHIIMPESNEDLYILDAPVLIEKTYYRFYFKFSLSPRLKRSQLPKTIVDLFKQRKITQYYIWTKKFDGQSKKTIALKTRNKHLVPEGIELK